MKVSGSLFLVTDIADCFLWGMVFKQVIPNNYFKVFVSIILIKTFHVFTEGEIWRDSIQIMLSVKKQNSGCLFTQLLKSAVALSAHDLHCFAPENSPCHAYLRYLTVKEIWDWDLYVKVDQVWSILPALGLLSLDCSSLWLEGEQPQCKQNGSNLI